MTVVDVESQEDAERRSFVKPFRTVAIGVEGHRS